MTDDEKIERARRAYHRRCRASRWLYMQPSSHASEVHDLGDGRERIDLYNGGGARPLASYELHNGHLRWLAPDLNP